MLYNYNNFLEKKINKIDLDIIYDKYYSNIDRNTFNKIVGSDPTSNIDDKLFMGKYSKWLINLFLNKKLKLEDLYKATEYLLLFDKQSVRNKISRKNIMDYDSLADLAKTVLPFKENEEILSKNEIKDANFVHEFQNYNLFIPRTFKDSCVLGKGTEWCTATEKTDKYYKLYHKPGRELLIFISKNDPKEKYQFHFRTKQFMNKFDEEINIKNFLQENPDINQWCKNNVKDYKKIKDDNIIYWSENNPKIVEGNFYCYNNNNLTSLEGAPEKVEGYFNCSNNNLTSLEGAPEIVEGDFYCSYNKLTTLEGAPEIVEGGFYCSDNNLTSLEGAPEIVEGNFNCSYNKLTSLEAAPEKVEGSFSCSDNNLTSLEGAPEKVEGYFSCTNNKLTTLEGAPEIVEGYFDCRNNPNLPKEEIERYKVSGAVKGIFYD
jgi:hypothetical protein